MRSTHLANEPSIPRHGTGPNDRPRPILPVLILGGGLAGLAAAHELHHVGIAFRLIEARNRLGGRILSVGADGQPAADGFDLGPSWFWPEMHPDMARYITDLGLEAFEQFSEGALLFQRSRSAPPVRYPAMRQEPVSMRIAGGTGALIAALASELPQDCIHLNTRAVGIRRIETGVSVLTNAGEFRAAQVICALPPRLLALTVTFEPAPETLALWHATPTWMAPHAKFLALYDRPFWREAGLSGDAQSQTGPMGEIHDATTASGKAALFGFLGVPAGPRKQAGHAAVIDACISQLGQLFGTEALRPTATLYHDWADDPQTATAEDHMPAGHPPGGSHDWEGPGWRDCLILAGSETVSDSPGYLAGAIAAGQSAAARIRERITT